MVCTIIFVFLIKSDIFYRNLLQYYLIQEICGYFFLVLGRLRFFILMLKSGAAPFHFWIFNVMGVARGWSLLWFLTVQKLPYFLVMIIFISFIRIYLLVLGIVICYLQLFFFRFWGKMILVISTESFNWLLLLSAVVFTRGVLLAFIYYIVMFFIIRFCENELRNFINWEMLLVFFNMPFCVTFLLKIIVLVIYEMFNYVFLIILVLIPFVSLGIVFWFVCIINVDLNFKKRFIFFLFPLMVLGFF